MDLRSMPIMSLLTELAVFTAWAFYRHSIPTGLPVKRWISNAAQ